MRLHQLLQEPHLVSQFPIREERKFQDSPLHWMPVIQVSNVELSCACGKPAFDHCLVCGKPVCEDHGYLMNNLSAKVCYTICKSCKLKLRQYQATEAQKRAYFILKELEVLYGLREAQA